MRTFGWIALLLAAAGAASAETSQERAKKLIDQCVTALGGPQFLAMENRVEEGRAYSFYRDQLSGLTRATIYTRYSPDPKPGKLAVRERQNFGKKAEYGGVLFTEAEAYQITFRGAQPLPDQRFKRYEDSTLRNIFYILRQRRNELGMIFESKGSDVLDNRPVDIVEITDAENRTMTVYLDQTTHLPVRQVFQWWNPEFKDRDEEVTLFTKYRDAGGGVQWPFSIQRNRNGEKIYQIFSETVRINQKLADSLFTLAAGIQMLKTN